MELTKVLWFIIVVIHIHFIYLLDHDLTWEFHSLKIKVMISCIVCVCGYKAVTIVKGNARTANFLASDTTAHFSPRPVDCSYFLITKWDTHTHTHTQPVGLLCTSDQPVAVIATYTTHTTDWETNIHALGGIRTLNPSKRASSDRRLRPHGHHRDLVNS